MPDTSTKRMYQIAADLRDEGAYLRANSVDAITDERDELLGDLNIARLQRDAYEKMALRLTDAPPLVLNDTTRDAIGRAMADVLVFGRGVLSVTHIAEPTLTKSHTVDTQVVDSNVIAPHCERDALPTELPPRPLKSTSYVLDSKDCLLSPKLENEVRRSRDTQNRTHNESDSRNLISAVLKFLNPFSLLSRRTFRGLRGSF